MEPLDQSFIDELKNKPEEKPKPKKKSTRKANPNTRDYATWFKLQHFLSEQCAFCPRVRVCIRLSEEPIVYICRYCFLEGRGLPK